MALSLQSYRWEAYLIRYRQTCFQALFFIFFSLLISFAGLRAQTENELTQAGQVQVLSANTQILEDRNFAEWIANRWEAPRLVDLLNGGLLAGVNIIGYSAGALLVEIPVQTAAGVIIYQGILTGLDTSFLQFQDNLFSNRRVGGVPEASSQSEFGLRLFKQWMIAEGTRFISGPILDASPIFTWQGQQEIFWNVIATGAAHSFVAMQRSRSLDRETSRVVNMASFALIGGLSTFDIMGFHLFNVPYLSELGFHGSNLMIWGAGLGLGSLVGFAPRFVERTSAQVLNRGQSIFSTCKKALQFFTK